MQCLAKSVASLADQSPFGFCFNSSHHSLEPTSGEHAARGAMARRRMAAAAIFLIGIGNSRHIHEIEIESYGNGHHHGKTAGVTLALPDV